MGLFDVAVPLLDWIDTQLLAWIPPLPRLAVWALAGAALTMGCYWQFSSQEEIARAGRDAAEARRALARFDGDFDEALSHVGRALSASLRQGRRMVWPALWASLPLLFLLPWLSASYGHSLPPAADEIAIHAYPEQAVLRARTRGQPHSSTEVERIAWPSHATKTAILDGQGRLLAELPLAQPIPVITKRQWWHFLFGSPVGYLPTDGEVEWLEIDLPRRHYLGFGPDWMRSWEVPFFLILMLCAGAMKFALRIS